MQPGGRSGLLLLLFEAAVALGSAVRLRPLLVRPLPLQLLLPPVVLRQRLATPNEPVPVQSVAPEDGQAHSVAWLCLLLALCALPEHLGG